MNSKIESTKLSERIPSLDFLRGIAIFGILFINIESFVYAIPWFSNFSPSHKLFAHVNVLLIPIVVWGHAHAIQIKTGDHKLCRLLFLEIEFSAAKGI